ncbi:uncharacterized protein A4U43_C08F1940 [Asparagus officinalis]|uniref:homeobox protein BEL1 homolog n=1 Tax=Asparagus officinalis TaxID=4686 RepID=UPI00098E3429|nr:homeobox protein BEL1 homolog [Asparagus officinalis]ONK59000.1 uncharacterized protein A4U43_C08F1940 [Asparagus officinalis]
MEFSSANNQMIMQGFEQPSGDLFGFHPANSNPNPNPDQWHADGFSLQSNQGLSLSLTNPMTSSHQEQTSQFVDDERLLFRSSSQQQTSPFILRRLKYLIPARELLNEFCSVGGINSSLEEGTKKKKDQWKEGGPSSSSSLCSLDLVELQKRKARLMLMLEEVHRRYRRYCEQMRAVVSSFESIAGEGSATVYSTLASKAMSRHFRCLKDGITSQIQATKMAMGERDSTAAAPGATKGETPRLKKLEQCLRQQKAFQNAGIMESQPWRPQRGLPERSVSVLRAWLFEHFLHPYPSDVDKHILARQTGLSRSQVSNWFINARVRLWKPMVEEMYMEELKEEEKFNPNSNPNPSAEEQKPVHGLLMNESDSLSSIINNSNNHPNPNANFGEVDLDFCPYDASGVSLTLGFSRDHIDDERQVQFSMLDEDGQTLPYRNLMDTHLLHDLAG